MKRSSRSQNKYSGNTSMAAPPVEDVHMKSNTSDLEERSQEDDQQAPLNIMSQVSIKSLEDAADQETKVERQKLQEKDNIKLQFAQQLRKNQETDIKNKTLSKQDKLNNLIRSTEQFTKFILQSNHQQQQKNQGNCKTQSKAAGSKRRKGGKSSGGPGDDDDVDENVITRLQTQPSILMGGKLRDYQLDSLNWLIGLYETGINGILADEMGLGKTIQTISFLAFLREFKKLNNYFLIIVPKAVIPNWKLEFKKWCPSIRVCNLVPTKAEREVILKEQLQPGKFDVCLTSFEAVRICMGPLSKFVWEYIIVDEAHKIKNEESQVSRRLRQLNSRQRLLLTGTPLQNNLHELWALLNFLLPEIFSSASDFDDWFDIGKKTDESMSDQEKELKNKMMIEQLHKLLRPFLLRRIKKEVEKTLPPKIEIHVTVGITEQQKKIYRDLLKKSTLEKGSSVTHYKNILIQLRKVCNHPYLFDGQEPDNADEFGEHIIQSSGKMQFLDKLVKRARKDGNQTLIFSGFTTMLDILEDFCYFRDISYVRLDGNTELDERERQIAEFVAPDSPHQVFLISTRAGGLGLNLMTANVVVLYDSDWNPQIDLQAMDRAHRIGQKKNVHVFRLVTTNTMEEKMIERQALKLKLDSMIIQKGRLAPKNQGLQKEEMQDMVNYGADTIFQVGSTGEIKDSDIDDLIKQGEERAQDMQKEAAEKIKDKFNMVDFEMNSVNLYQFEDVDYMKQRREDQAIKMNDYVTKMIMEDTNRGRRQNQKKINLSESNLCPKIFQGRNIGISEETKKKKLLKVQDFRFFPRPDRLKELIEKEINAKYSGYFQGIETVTYTNEERIEKELLWSKGFMSWDRREYQKFCQALETYAKTDYKNIGLHMGETKTIEEIEAYAKVFFEQIDTLNDAEKIKKNIEKAEQMLNFKQKAPEIIKQKVTAYQDPLEEMKIDSTQKSKYFTKESDIVLLCLTHKHGYGNWTEIKRAIRHDPRCRFDHLFMSRNESEIQKRVDILVKALEKEFEQESIRKNKREQEKLKLSNQAQSNNNNNNDGDGDGAMQIDQGAQQTNDFDVHMNDHDDDEESKQDNNDTKMIDEDDEFGDDDIRVGVTNKMDVDSEDERRYQQRLAGEKRTFANK